MVKIRYTLAILDEHYHYHLEVVDIVEATERRCDLRAAQYVTDRKEEKPNARYIVIVDAETPVHIPDVSLRSRYEFVRLCTSG